jgi:hypothetical protein
MLRPIPYKGHGARQHKERASAAAAGFHENDADIVLLGEARSYNRTRRSAADYDVVSLHYYNPSHRLHVQPAALLGGRQLSSAPE